MNLAVVSSGSGGGGNKVVFAVIAVVVIAGGILQAVRPDVGWKMSRWQFKNKDALEPSNAGLTAARVVGAVVAVVGIVILVVGLSH